MKTKMKINEDDAHILKMSASEIMEKLKSESDFLSGKFLAVCSIEDVEKNVVIEIARKTTWARPVDVRASEDR